MYLVTEGFGRWKWNRKTASVKAFEYVAGSAESQSYVEITFYYEVNGKPFSGRGSMTEEFARSCPGVDKFLERQRSGKLDGNLGLEEKVFIVRGAEIPINIRIDPQDPSKAVLDSRVSVGLLFVGTLLIVVGVNGFVG